MKHIILIFILAASGLISSAQSVPVVFRSVYAPGDSTDAFRQDADMFNALAGNFNPRNCRLTYDEANALGCAVTTVTAGTQITPESQIRDLYNHAEAEVFIGFGQRLSNVTQCQLTLVDKYLPRQGSSDTANPQIQEQINEKVINKFTEHEEAFERMKAEHGRLQMARNSAFHSESTVSMDDINSGQRQIRTAQEILIRELPFGNQELVREKMLEYVRNNRDINITGFRAAYREGVSLYQAQLASSKRRLDWALLPPERVEAYEATSSYSCRQRRSGGVTCLDNGGRPPANAQERADLNYGRDVGPPGFTNAFKQEIIAGDLTAMEEYLDSIGQGSPASDSFLCNVRSNHISGANLRRGATIALELAGIVPLSLAFPLGGAAARGATALARGTGAVATGTGEAALVGANVAARTERLLGLTARGGRSITTSYAISMTPLIPRIVDTCMGPESQTVARMASYNNTECSPEASLQFTMEESRLAECATEVAFAAGELAVAGTLARVARRAAAVEPEEIVVSAIRPATRVERQSVGRTFRAELRGAQLSRSERREVVNMIASLRRRGVSDAAIRSKLNEALTSCPAQVSR